MRAARVQIAAQELADLGGFCVELLDQAADVIPIAGEPRLKIVKLAREDCFDDAHVDWLGPDLEPGLERADEVLADLQWGLEFAGKKHCSFIGHHVVARHTLGECGFGRIMPYVTGGFAYGGVKPLSDSACSGCLSGDTPYDYSKTQTGWTVGGGAEVPLGPRLGMKAEYLYVRLDQAAIGTLGGEINTLGFGPLYNASLAEGATANIVRVGLNYHV